MRSAGRSCLLAAVLLLAAPSCFAATYAERLRAADKVRSSDAAAFRHMLDELEATKAQARPAELDHLRLLHDYRNAIEGRYEAALGDAMALHDQAADPVIRYRATLLIANTAAITRDFALGLRYLERALQMQDDMKDAEARNAASLVASTVYNEYGQYQLARQYAQQVVESDASPRTRCIARQNLVESLYRLGQPIDETADIQDAISRCLAENETVAASFIRATLARHWADEGKKQQATSLLEGSLADAEGTKYTRLVSEYHGLLAELRLALGDVAGAARHARRVVDAPGQDPRSTPNIVAHRVLFQIAFARGDYRAALDEYRQYAEADKARLDDIKAREYAFQLSRHELNQKNQLLQSQGQLLRLQQEAARASAWNFRLITALLLVLTGSFAYWAWRARRTHGSLRQLAETDGLTGLANRRHFRAGSEAALAQCAQRQRPVSVLLFDLDHFKQINDQCGHSLGDWVLREVARVGRLHCRDHDLFGRIGGEEFAMTLVDCDVVDALRIAEACRRSIADIDAGSVGCHLPVAASIGVVGSTQVGYDYEALIAHADAAMYRSKVGGRDRVTLYEPPVVPEPGQPVLLDRRNAEAMLRQY